MNLRSRPATIDDVKAVFPEQSCSFKALACEMDGERVGVIGIALKRPTPCVFCWFDERLRPHLRSMTVMRMVKKLDDWLAGITVPVAAIRDRKERNAVHILKRLGFEFYGLHEGEAIYVREG